MSHRAPLVLDEVRKIAVLRPNAVGDFVFALPALHALKRTYPDAELVLLGKGWHADFLKGRPGPVDRVVVVPPLPGVGAPGDALPAPDTTQRFVQQMRGERFDIAAQMYGGGRHSNRLLMRFGARLSIGARTGDARPLDRWVHYPQPGNRRLALLEVAALAGAAPVMPAPELAVTEADRREAASVLAPEPGERLALLQPGATDPRRCWPAERFAFVGDALARAGARLAVNGSAAEAPLARTVIAAMRAPAANLAGRLTLGGLCGLLERATLMVANDTGPLHLALAVGTPAVGIFWLTNLIDGTPLRQDLLRAALSVRVQCPVCGAENLRSRCPHDESFVADVPTLEVAAMATALLREAR
jgi:ADP-heptose:LPS heptosyltransferase